MSAVQEMKALYESGASLATVAEVVGKGTSTVRYHLLRAGVTLRDPAEIQKGRRKVGVDEAVVLYREGLTAEEAAKKLGVSKRTVLLRLREAGAVRERDRSWVDPALELYKSGLTGQQVADEIGVPLSTVGRVIREAGISRPSSSYLDLHGENNPNWRGGVSFDPYPVEFNDRLKARIRERDGYCCRECGLAEKDHRTRYPSPYNGTGGQNLSIHHIDYDKSNCAESNLISLCQACNARANGRRNYWKRHFQEMLKEAV